jgi:hypothetical protein
MRSSRFSAMRSADPIAAQIYVADYVDTKLRFASASGNVGLNGSSHEESVLSLWGSLLVKQNASAAGVPVPSAATVDAVNDLVPQIEDTDTVTAWYEHGAGYWEVRRSCIRRSRLAVIPTRETKLFAGRRCAGRC